MKTSVLVVCLCLSLVASGMPQQTPGDVDALLAPIALYPDQLLGQILMCATDPASVDKMEAFLKANPKLKGTELQDAALVKGFEPSFVALALFPDVIHRMAAKPDWTALVGQIFVANRTAVFASIQKLRAQARAVGTLKSNDQQQIATQTTTSGEEVIVIEPTNPQVVYVPQYNSTTVYTTAPTTTTNTVIVQDNSADALAAGMIGFTAGIAIGAAVNNNYYHGAYGWGGGAYMYNDAWDDYYDHREDAREDWQDHREDIADERGDRAGNAQEQRTERTENRSDTRSDRSDNRADTQSTRTADGTKAASRGSGTAEARGTSERATSDRSGTKSDAFSGYSSGKSERAASSRGNASRSSSRSRGGGGGGRRR